MSWDFIRNKIAKIVFTKLQLQNMAKTAKKKTAKKRASTYEKPVKFNGTFEDMIAISTTGAGIKKKETKKK